MSKGRGRSNPRPAKHVSGFVSILGRPNAGKSTLLNALVGTKVAIVADKPQTTRTTIQGVWTSPAAQVVFVDTPGIHDAGTIFNRRMMQSINEALSERDLLLYLIDSTRAPGAEDEKALELIKGAHTPAIAVFNKVDALENPAALLPLIDRYRQWHEFDEFLPLSALKGVGLEELRAAILKRLPAGPAWFPADHVTDQPERFLAAEIIREKILASTRAEVPHSVAVLVDEWKEEGRLTRVSATVHVERPGQKAIIVGARGAMLKQIGSEARLEIERLLGRKLFLALFVKVSPKWRENERFLKELDWRAMTGGDAPQAPQPDDNEEE
ncbi:MAG: GTPase Era [Acidobacteria bacterium]|nr:GTPase Era [Acidobacteriota bacterium]